MDEVFGTHNVGIAMVATLRSSHPDQAKIRYKVFADLLTLFRRAR